MIIVDVETTGVNPDKHSILSIGAIDFNNPASRFSIECSAFPGAHADEEALAITGHNKESIFDLTKPSEAEAIKEFIKWMNESSDHTIAGQNCYFDAEFLIAAARRAGQNISVPKRIVDLHSVAWAHIIKAGHSVPIDEVHKHSGINSDFICDYVGIPREAGPHVGMPGAMWEAESFSRLFFDKPLLDEYRQHKIPWA